jgi:hypothetical protein
MAQPAAIAQGIAFAFPDVCNTPAPPGPPVPVPYPNIAQLADASGTSADGGAAVYANGKPILLGNSEIATSSGDEAGSASPTKGKCTFASGGSGSVTIHGQKVIRFGDPTSQNGGNAQGSVLSAPSTVMVGG